MKTLSILRSVPTVLLFGCVIGCGSDGPALVPVNGKVLKDDQVMTNVSITMVPVGSGVAAMGSADKSGNIYISTNGRSGAAVGKYKIGFTEPIREMTPEALKSGNPPAVSFNKKFESPMTSGIEFDVPEKGGTFEFKITSK